MAKTIVVEERKCYTLSDKALEQRRSAANKKTVSCLLHRIEEKLKFHVNDYLRIQEISTMLIQSFTFDEIVELYRSDYDDVFQKKMNVLRTCDLKSYNWRVLLRACRNKSRVLLLMMKIYQQNEIHLYVRRRKH